VAIRSTPHVSGLPAPSAVRFIAKWQQVPHDDRCHSIAHVEAHPNHLVPMVAVREMLMARVVDDDVDRILPARRPKRRELA
jgi:hypothetical protein